MGVDKVAYRPNFPTGLHPRPRYTTGFAPTVPAEEIQLKPRKVLMKKYVFSGAAISKLKAAVSAGLNGSELLKRQPTRVEIVIGLSLSELLERVDQHEIELLNQLVHLLSDSDDTPLVTVQFNMFECGGLAIGLGVLHRILDAFSTFAFINAFAAISKLKAAVSGSEQLKRQPTRVEVMVALTWNTLMKVAEARNGHLRPSISRFAVNLRGIEDNTTDT
ncbi:diaboline synthase-like [Populus alba]|uniref:diaboline synthase-like n=1 Tax=Populus alba TaxID=43335 RepID=UPI0015889907|nr:uncharacterized protein LOC118059619 [Populus alba]